MDAQEAVVPQNTVDSVTEVVENNVLEAKNVVKAATEAAVKSATSAEKKESTCSCAFKLSPEAKDLVYWSCPKKTGAVVAGGLIVFYLLFVGPYTLMTLFSYLALTALTFNLIYVNGTKAFASFQGRPAENPLKFLLEKNMAVSTEDAKAFAEQTCKHANTVVAELKSVVLIEDNMKSLKAAGVLYAIAMVGKIFCLPMIMFLVFVGLFSIPKVYEMYQVQIDAQIDCAKALIKEYYQKAAAKVEEKMPAYFKSKAKTE